jgi:invasion protein IalB
MAIHIRRRNSRLGALTSLAVISVIAISRSAFGQSPARELKSPNSAEFTPRGERIARDISYGDWKKFCFKPAGTKATCRTMITGTFATGQTAVRVDLVERDGEPKARLQLPYTWCLTNACIAADLADPSLLKEMETGQTLLLRVVDTSVVTVTTEISLKDFARTRRDAPEKVFEQTIDE